MEQKLLFVQSLLSPLQFGSFIQVSYRASVSDLFKSGRIPGLYVLAFSDGAFYAGKTVDIKQRYLAHNRNHADIDYFAFKPLSPELQDLEERPLVQMLKNNGILLRNIQFISNPDTPREFDVLVPPQAQAQWVATGECLDQQQRQINAEQRYRYTRKHEKLATDSIYKDLCSFLREYARIGLIAPKMTEMCYWCMTVLPSPSAYVGHRTNKEYARLNIGGCEVLTIGKEWVYQGCHPGPFFAFHVAKTGFEGIAPIRQYLSGRHPGVLPLDHAYEAMGEDQLSLVAFGFDSAHGLINDPILQRAIRIGNLGLMRKRACFYSQNHCFDLVVPEKV